MRDMWRQVKDVTTEPMKQMIVINKIEREMRFVIVCEALVHELNNNGVVA